MKSPSAFGAIGPTPLGSPEFQDSQLRNLEQHCVTVDAMENVYQEIRAHKVPPPFTAAKRALERTSLGSNGNGDGDGHGEKKTANPSRLAGCTAAREPARRQGAIDSREQTARLRSTRKPALIEFLLYPTYEEAQSGFIQPLTCPRNLVLTKLSSPGY